MRSNSRLFLRFLPTLLLVLAGAGMATLAVQAGTDAESAAAAWHAYSVQVATTYDFRFGKDAAFLPSNATTDTGEFIDAKSFPTADYCGHCHREAHAQWRESAHANSNRPPWYQRNVDLLKTEKGVAYTRHCEGCHNPMALVSGALTEGAPAKHAYDEDGVTCSVCHSIQSVDARGTGSYVMGVPAVLVDEAGQPIRRPVSDAEIMNHLDRHSQAVMKDFYRSSEFCASCHKAALPRTLNGYKWLRAFSVYDEWQMSSFAKQSPLPFYTKDIVSTCQTCHMRHEEFAGDTNRTLASHRWLGANTLIPQYYGYAAQAEKTAAFLTNSVFNVDLFALEQGREDAPAETVAAPLGTHAFAIAPGAVLTAEVVIQNKGIAHSHVPEQRDMYESWVDFVVKDAAGKVLSESGFLKPGGALEERAHSFTNRLINAKGGLNDLHQVWNNRVVAYNNTIQSGRSQLVRYSFRMPAEAGDAVTLTATVKYRRFDQHFIDFGMDKPYEQPVVDMVSASRTIRVGQNQPQAPAAGETPEWMRWNNDGIALLDAQQYASSLAAFQHVAKLRPDYADAYTNMAIAEIQWERYDDARPHLETALKLAPGNARALYYRALVKRNEGDLDAAIVDLEAVLKDYPRSRDARRELGFSFYQQHRYPEAMEQYKLVQTIDPDDLAAHYNLSLIYRRLGMKDQAAAEAALFADQKDDPTAATFALDYLRQHNELSNESVPWHTHDLTAAPVADAAAEAAVRSRMGAGQR